MNNTPSESRKRRQRSIVVVGNKTTAVHPVSSLLRRFGYDVHEAIAATQAFELICTVRPDLVLTDVILPGLGGVDLIQKLKQDKRTVFIPVVFMISPGDTAAEARCLAMEAADCIPKPVQVEDLYRTVQQIVETRPRENIRIDTRLPVSVNDSELDCVKGECEVDLSEHGMYVPMQKPYHANQRVFMKIGIKDRTISTQGAVLYSLRSSGWTGPRREPGMGLKFVSLAPQDREFIRKFIREELARDIGEVA